MTVTLNWNMKHHLVIHHALMSHRLASLSPQLRSQILPAHLGSGGNDTVLPLSKKSSRPNGVMRSCTGEDATSSHEHSDSFRVALRILRPRTHIGVCACPMPSETGASATHDGGHGQKGSHCNRVTVSREGLLLVHLSLSN